MGCRCCGTVDSGTVGHLPAHRREKGRRGGSVVGEGRREGGEKEEEGREGGERDEGGKWEVDVLEAGRVGKGSVGISVTHSHSYNHLYKYQGLCGTSPLSWVHSAG